jgi:hypothetical protein
MEWQSGMVWPHAGVDVAAAWAESGAQWLTAPGVAVPARMVAGAAGLVRRLDERGAGLADLYGAAGLGVLSTHAAALGLRGASRISCGEATRLIRARDEWIAVSLARPDDHRSLPAWLGTEHDDPRLTAIADPWSLVADLVRTRRAAEMVELGALLGLACSMASEVAPDLVGESPVLLENRGEAPAVPLRGARVASLAALWAGPLTADVLRRLGADVVSVESIRRPDGARATAAWYASLHAGQRSVALDLGDDQDVARLASLLRSADVVIEGSRPRALQQLGIDAAEIVGEGPQLWVSITGHGRQPPGSTRIAFGDDAAVAGGLVGRLADGPVFIADAVADPLAGLTAAATVVELLERGGRWIVDVALSRVAAAAASRPDDPVVAARLPAVRPRWKPGGVVPVPLGLHTLDVMTEWGVDR